MRGLICTLIFSAALPAQDIPFDSVVNPLNFPANITLGEAAGVATDSKGDIFVYTRTGHPTISIGTARPFAHGGSRLVEFDRTGKFLREIGHESYGFLVAQQVRIDAQDNIWVVDQMSSMVIKFDPEGHVQLLLGRKSESETVPARPLDAPARGGRGPAGAGQQSDLFSRPTDVAWDAAGDIYIADGLGNSRVAKFDKNGKFIKSWGSRGTMQGQFNSGARDCARCARERLRGRCGGTRGFRSSTATGISNRRLRVSARPRRFAFLPGQRQVLYSSNSNPPEDIDSNGEIYKVDLSGQVLGKFGMAGKLPKEFSAVNAIDCRRENELYVGETGNWRVQKLALHPK